MKRALGALLAAVGLATAGPASAVIVGGINFQDIGGNQNIETQTLAETYVDGVGQNLQGYGEVTSVNGNTSYCASGPCTLYYYFTNYTVSNFTGSGVTFTGGTVNIYYSSANPINLLTQSSANNVTFITGLTQWVQLTGHTFTDPTFNTTYGLPGATYTLNGDGTLTGGSLSEKGAGQLDVNTSGTWGMSAVASFLNGNGFSDLLGGFADMILTVSSNNSVLNTNDPGATPIGTGTCYTNPQVGDWCLQGTLNTRGIYTVPEPATLALVGLGLLGLSLTGARSRRKKRS